MSPETKKSIADIADVMAGVGAGDPEAQDRLAELTVSVMMSDPLNFADYIEAMLGGKVGMWPEGFTENMRELAKCARAIAAQQSGDPNPAKEMMEAHGL